MRRVDHIILRPLQTEKTAVAEADNNQFTFEVGLDATKLEVKQAIEELFGVKARLTEVLAT